jgi:hypothetical protein
MGVEEDVREQLSYTSELVAEFRRFNALMSGEENPIAGDLANQLGIGNLSTKTPGLYGSPGGPSGTVNNDLSEGAFSRLTRGKGNYQSLVSRAHVAGIPASKAAMALSFADKSTTQMTPEEYSALAPNLGPSASGRAAAFPTDEQMASGIAAMTPWAPVRAFEHMQRLMGTIKSGAAGPEQAADRGTDRVPVPAQRFMSEQQSSMYPQITDPLRINPANWERFLRESPRSQNVERRDIVEGPGSARFESVGMEALESDVKESERMSLQGAEEYFARGRAPVQPSFGVDWESSINRAITRDRRETDRGLADEANIRPSGNLNVNVRAPAGTEVKASGDGMFKDNVSLDRQMSLPTLQ